MKKPASEIKQGDVVTWVGAFKDYVIIEGARRDPDIRRKVRVVVDHPRGAMTCRLNADEEVVVRSVAPDLPFSASDEHPIPWSIENRENEKRLVVSDGNGIIIALLPCSTPEQYRGIQKRVGRINDHDRRQADFTRFVENTGGSDKLDQIAPLDVWLNSAKAEAEEKDARIEHLEAVNRSLQSEIDDLQDALDTASNHAHSIIEATEPEQQEGDGN